MQMRRDNEVTRHNMVTRKSNALEFLQWNHSCDLLMCLVNSSASKAKILLFDGVKSHVVDINKLERVTNSKPRSKCTKILPGTVEMIDERVWHVVVADGVVELSNFLDGAGHPITPQMLADQCHIDEGAQLPVITTEHAEWLSIVYSECFAKFEACEISCMQTIATGQSTWVVTDYRKVAKDTTATETAVAWLTYIARFTGTSHLQIGWDADEYLGDGSKACKVSSLICAFTEPIPFGIFLDTNDTFSEALASFEECYKQLMKQNSSDTLFRHTLNDLFSKKSWTLAVSLIDTNIEFEYSSDDDNDLDSDVLGSLMTLQINKQNGDFRWIYDSNQILQEEVDRISSRLVVLLASAKSKGNDKKAVAELGLLPEAERKLLLYTWNQTTVSQSSVRFLHQLFESRLECDGQAIAVECNGEFLSYEELNLRSNRIAHHLIAKGVKPDDRITLCVDRSTAMIVAILGILKAGCAYVPLDPVYKSQRLTNILIDAGSVFLLADTTGRNAIGDQQVPVIDLENPLPSDLPIDNPDANKLGITSANLAYVIYTSGSTGMPKGVMVEHQQVTRLFGAARDKYDFNERDKWCLFHSFSFDVSVWETWNAWYYGSQLSIASYSISRSSNEFYDWICTNGITVLNQTPSAFKMLLRPITPTSRSDRLRYIIFAGEDLDPLIAKGWHESRGTIVYNMYGPTETLHATIYRLEALENIRSIGQPISDLCAYLLNSYGEPVPLGAGGELYISGASVARGYLNRLDLTAERFLPDPFRRDRVARMYRTGDLAQYLPDGNLMYLGRIDQQVKIRGFRIELGEIEARLVEHPQVREAVVQSYGDASDTRLVAYVVADADSTLAQNLRTYLSTQLPDHMVPAAYVCLNTLPLTPNGKLDRRALPTPDDEAFAHEQYEAPQGEIEQKLVKIWSELLSIEHISRHDNFFALGGHSMLVPQLLAELRQIGLDTRVSEVFDASNLTKLASTLNRYKPKTIPTNLITKDSTAITPEMLPLITLSPADIDAIIAKVPGGVANIQDIYGLTPLQNGMLYHHLMADEGDVYLLVSKLRFDDRSALDHYVNTLQQMMGRHDILRTIVFWDGLSEPAQVVLRQAPSPLSKVQIEESGKPVLEILSQKFDSRHYRLDLTQSPLIRVMAAEESPDGSWVAIQLMHHTIVDHLTLEWLQEEINIIMNGKIETLKASTLFRNFVAQLRLETSLAEHTNFFTEMLDDIDEPTLPFGLIDIGQAGGEINEVYLNLSQTLNDQLRAHARNLMVSLASICHLAFAQVLAKASRRESVVFGTMLLGRSQGGEENHNVMGPTFNSLPLRLDIDETSVETAVRHTHAQLSALLAHEHAPLVLAQRCSGVPAGLPLFSALLNYRHNLMNEKVTGQLPGVRVIEFLERTNYPLDMSVEDNGSSLALTVKVITSVSAGRVGLYMKQALQSLADALSHSSQRSIRNLNVLPLEERTLLMHKWNQTTHLSFLRCPLCRLQCAR